VTGTADPPGQDEYPGDPIIVVTLQTFPFVLDKLGELEARNYAVIVDEAPSGQTGTSAGGMKAGGRPRGRAAGNGGRPGPAGRVTLRAAVVSRKSPTLEGVSSSYLAPLTRAPRQVGRPR